MMMGTYGGKLIKYIRSNARQDDANQRMAINFFIGLPLFCPDEGRYNARWQDIGPYSSFSYGYFRCAVWVEVLLLSWW